MSGATIHRLLQVVTTLSGGDPDQRWLADTIKEVIEEGGSLDERLGIRWEQRLGLRDALIREVHQRYFPNDEPYAAAGKIDQLAKEVAKLARLGRFDQIAFDDPRRLIADAMNVGLRFPKERQLLNVLSPQ
jgi:hypothetical protein